MSTKVKLSSDVSTKLQFLSNRLDIRRNLIARMAFGYALNAINIPVDPTDSNGQEFNRVTLTGKYDALFRLLMSEKEERLIVDDEFFPIKLKEYVEYGVNQLYLQYMKINSPGEFLIFLLSDEKVQTKLSEPE